MRLEASLMVRVADALTVSGVAHLLAGSFSSKYIEGWCERHGTLALLEELRRSVPKL